MKSGPPRNSDSLPDRLRTAWQRALSVATERWWRIDTTGRVEATTPEGVHYTPLPYVIIFRILDHLELGPRDVFVDIGSGKGRVLCCAARRRLSRVVGIEPNEDLVRVARGNMSRLRGVRTPVDLVVAMADAYDFADATVVYLYNPFGYSATAQVMETLARSHAANPRRLRVVYANPVHDQAMLEQHRWLKKTVEWPAADFPGFGYPVSFWESLPTPVA